MLFVAHLWASRPGGLSPAAPVLEGAETGPSASAAWTGPRADWRPKEEEEVKLKGRRKTEWRDKGLKTNQDVRRARWKGWTESHGRQRRLAARTVEARIELMNK